jgi:colicin import membrane protein
MAKQTPEQIAEAKVIKAAQDKAAKEAKAVEAAAAKEAKAKAALEAKAAAAAAKANAEAKDAEAIAAKAAKDAEAKALKEKAAAEKLELKAKEKAEKDAIKLANKMPTQNGITRPKPEGKTGKAWALMDKMSAEKRAPVAISELVAVNATLGMNPNMLKSQYASWRKFNGVVGRAVVTAAPAAATSAAV